MTGAPKKKVHQKKAVAKKEMEHLAKEISRPLLNLTTSHCFDSTRTKLKDHLNPWVIQFALVLEASVYTLCSNIFERNISLCFIFNGTSVVVYFW